MSGKIARKITVPSLVQRSACKDLQEFMAIAQWDEATVLEVCQRYCDTQAHAQNYRQRTAARNKALKARLEELAKASGLSVDEYLEMESANLSEGGAE